MLLSVSHDFLPKQNSVRAAQVMDHFGIDFEQGRHVIAEGLELPIKPGQVVLFTGASGSGKSSLMRAVSAGLACNARDRVKCTQGSDGGEKGREGNKERGGQGDSGTAQESVKRGSPSPPLLFSPPLTLHFSTVANDASRSPLISLDDLTLPDALLIDALDLPADEAMNVLSSCGLGEAHLMLRTPSELSDGQRYRFRLALALSKQPQWVIADEFTATLDRTLAKVIAFNIRRLADRTGTGFLLATTHEDVAEDLAPELHVRCRLDGEIGVERQDDVAPHKGSSTLNARLKKKRIISFTSDLWLSDATRHDWPYFARWHYRSHHLGLTRKLILLWHGHEPIGICVFVSPPISLKLRNRFFGRSGKWTRTALKVLNRQLVLLQRVVIHPTYRGAGIAAAFVRRACELCPHPWIETLTQMGHINPFFEKAGFTRVGVVSANRQSRRDHSALYGGKRRARQTFITHETFDKSRFANPVYYIFDNRGNVDAPRP